MTIIQAYVRTITHSPNSIDECGETYQLEPITDGLRESGYQGFDRPISVELLEGWDVWESEGYLFIASRNPSFFSFEYTLSEAWDTGIANILPA